MRKVLFTVGALAGALMASPAAFAQTGAAGCRRHELGGNFRGIWNGTRGIRRRDRAVACGVFRMRRYGPQSGRGRSHPRGDDSRYRVHRDARALDPRYHYREGLVSEFVFGFPRHALGSPRACRSLLVGQDSILSSFDLFAGSQAVSKLRGGINASISAVSGFGCV